MDVHQAIRDTENALRDFVSWRLQSKFGVQWESKIGVTDDRLTKWREKRETERKRHRGVPIEERLFYYADLYDLQPIIKKHWLLLADALGTKGTIEVWLDELERLRTPDAHGRDFLPHQKHLAIGIAGHVRGSIVRYRSKMERIEDYFPRIEGARDSVDHSFAVGSQSVAVARPTVRVGDAIECVVTATDPMGEPLEYGYYWHPGGPEAWSHSNSFVVSVTADNVGKHKELHLRVRSPREAKAMRGYDDFVIFSYDVLPARTKKSASS